jgi:hypothetical protein
MGYANGTAGVNGYAAAAGPSSQATTPSVPLSVSGEDVQVVPKTHDEVICAHLVRTRGYSATRDCHLTLCLLPSIAMGSQSKRRLSFQPCPRLMPPSAEVLGAMSVSTSGARCTVSTGSPSPSRRCSTISCVCLHPTTSSSPSRTHTSTSVRSRALSSVAVS